VFPGEGHGILNDRRAKRNDSRYFITAGTVKAAPHMPQPTSRSRVRVGQWRPGSPWADRPAARKVSRLVQQQEKTKNKIEKSEKEIKKRCKKR